MTIHPDLSTGRYRLTVERNMNADAHTLYDAWTSKLDDWLAEPGTVLMAPEVDKPFFFETRFDERCHPHYGRFLALVPDRLIKLTWVTGSAGTKGAETIITIELNPARTGTHLKLTQCGFCDEESRNAHELAWPKVLEHLDVSMTTRQRASA
jgi:uncharacterized protein YndB with AHSA1/START domain